jgi:ABC-type transport system involved in cytochrome c biogenesis permease subunit
MLTLDLTVKILIISASGIYLLSFILALLKRVKTAMGLFALGWLVNLAVFIINWVIAQNPPFGNMYHVMSFLPLCLLPLFFYVKYVQKLGWLLPFFAISAVLPLVGTLFMGQEIVWNRMPALQSPWFVPHVSTYILSYALAAVAFLLTCSYYYADDREKYSEAAYKMMLIAFPFMTFGLFSGALWAEEAWGSYWSWDIKEVWSLITWSLYLIYFHCRFSRDIRKWQHVAHIFAFCALIITFFVVNLLPKITSLHSYAK